MKLKRSVRVKIAIGVLTVFGLSVVGGLWAYYLYNAVYFWQLMMLLGIFIGVLVILLLVAWAVETLKDRY